MFIKHPYNVWGTKWYLNVKCQVQRSYPFIHLQNRLKSDINLSMYKERKGQVWGNIFNISLKYLISEEHLILNLRYTF